MSKLTKNISFSTLVREAEKLFPDHQKKDIRIFDVSTPRMPEPQNIQISLNQLNHTPGKKVTSAFHQKFVLKIHLTGSSIGCIEKNQYCFKPGEGILVFPFQFHRILETPEKKGQFRLLANFTLSQEAHALLEPLRDRIIRFSPKEIYLISRMLRHAAGKQPDDDREAVFALSFLLVSLLDRASDETKTGTTLLHPFQAAIDYIHAHFREHLTGKEIAFALGCSESGLRKMFLHGLGQTPGNLMQDLRLNDAAEKLRSSDFSIQEISRLSGFSNPYSFSRAFHKRFKLSPRDFRKT